MYNYKFPIDTLVFLHSTVFVIGSALGRGSHSGATGLGSSLMELSGELFIFMIIWWSRHVFVRKQGKEKSRIAGYFTQ